MAATASSLPMGLCDGFSFLVLTLNLTSFIKLKTISSQHCY